MGELLNSVAKAIEQWTLRQFVYNCTWSHDQLLLGQLMN